MWIYDGIFFEKVLPQNAHNYVQTETAWQTILPVLRKNLVCETFFSSSAKVGIENKNPANFKIILKLAGFYKIVKWFKPDYLLLNIQQFESCLLQLLFSSCLLQSTCSKCCPDSRHDGYDLRKHHFCLQHILALDK